MQPAIDNPQRSGSTVVNSYCQADSAAESTFIRVRRSLVDPREASDSYGRRLGRRFLVYEVTVENNNPAFQHILHDVSVDLSRLHHLPPGTYRWAFSSQDLIMLRGVPEKGSDLDPRNLTYHLARGTGAVAGGVTGIVATGVQDIFAGATAAFNGPLLSAFIDIFPDHTATQLNRLSDSAFTANGVVAKQAAKTFAIFVPEGLFLTHKEQNQYWNEPVAIFGSSSLDYRQADVCVDGAFIAEVPVVAFTSAVYDDPASLKAEGPAAVTVQGANLQAGDTVLDAFGASFPISAVDGANSPGASGTTGHVTVTLPKGWTLAVDEPVALESKKTGQKSPPFHLHAPYPVLLTLELAKTKPPTVTIKGAGLLAGLTDIDFDNGAGKSTVEKQVTGITDGTSGTAEAPDVQYCTTTTPCTVRLKRKDTGSLSQPVQF